MIALSVIICTHNPREKYLDRVIAALKTQTLPQDRWELLLIDNASLVSLETVVNLTWHSSARYIRENELGLTPARLRGIAEAKSELLVFVDDDNVLDQDYLEQAIIIHQKHHMLGAWGGNIRGEFEVPPPAWLRPYFGGLAVSEIENDRWSNEPGLTGATPCGAGLCLRSVVARAYAEKTRHDSLRKSLGRSGLSLGAGEDGDLAWTSLDMGMGTGRFASLKLTHLIPKERMTKEYVIRLYAGFASSWVILERLRPGPPPPRRTFLGKLREFLNFWRKDALSRRVLRASAMAKKAMESRINAHELK